MTDWMDRIADEARLQGYGVRQTAKGTWVFSKGGDTWTAPRTPTTSTEWTLLLTTLRAMGLDLPDQDDDRDGDQGDDQE